MKLYFVRHGESEANTLRVISNRGPKHALTEKGQQQAMALAQTLKGITVHKIFSSPVLRAVQTAEILAAELGMPCEITDALREFDCGVIDGRGDADAWRLHTETIEAWIIRQEWDRRIEQGESFNDIRSRFVPFIEGLVQEYASTPGAIILLGHGGTYWCMLPLVLSNVDYQFIADHGFDHTTPIIAEPRPGGLVCLAWGNTKLE